jgi:hypothetical protein
MVSQEFVKELGIDHKSRRHKSSSSYLTSMDYKSETISLKVDM